MATFKFNYPPIEIGYVWDATIVLRATPSLFEPTAQLRAEVRKSPTDPVVATLTTENGLIRVLDANSIYVKLPGTGSSKLKAGTASFDLVRTDYDEDRHLGVTVIVPVKAPITRPEQ